MYDIVFFDLDGTLTDSGDGIRNSFMYALDKYNIQVSDRSELDKFIGPPLHESFSKYFNFSEDECKRAVELYREYFRDKGIYENELYPGIKELLERIKKSGRKIVLATSKPEEFAIRILKYFSIDEYFDFMAGSTMDGSRGTKSDVINYALKNCGSDNLSQIVMIGDREHDIIGARQAGIDSVGVLYGYGSYDELQAAGATYIIENVEDIISVL